MYVTTRYTARGSYFRVVSLAFFLGLLTLTAACDRYVDIPPSAYADIESKASEEWQVETATAIYGVKRFAVTDSTLVIEDAAWVESKVPTASRYPADLPKRTEHAEVPIVLPLDDVTRVERLEFSGERTAFMVLGVAGAAAAVTFFVILLYALSYGTS
jgi:hypothetical protein